MIDGVTIRAGEPALAVLAAANRDPDIFHQPNDFSPGRSGPAPLSFGYGTHHCLGAALARLEITTALQHIMVRRPALCGEPAWRDTPAIRGPLRLPIAFTN
ncbi:cytochrome P450 [Mycolicibacterium sp. P1-5]|uniref:cytochrome P450 n=1 Tax=Mycolicibacterium sp. P1-5 TaxID=2024617 RepID=UPI001D1417DF|nr:cytochrome P450 [Mycolicibacterium sp. P1-5]